MHRNTTKTRTRRAVAVPVDDRLPRKPAATTEGAAEPAAPTYSGAKKTDKPPARKARHAGPDKPAAGKVQRPRVTRKKQELGDQVPAATNKPAEPEGEQYIRLRIRVRGDRLTVVDSHLVDGPLGQTQVFSTPNAYEITLGDRLLHAGALPDIGTQRSFVNPDPKAGQQGHFITELPIYEFTARVAAHEVTPETISAITLRLHRIKEEARTDRLGSEPLAVQFPREMRPVGELVGLPESVLPAAIDARGGRTPSV